MKQVYANIQWDKKKQKKTVSFADKKDGKWGSLTKDKANATAIVTGNGLVVVDIDTHDMSQLDPELVKMLPPEPTIKTKRGYHYYFNVKDSETFTTKTDVFKHVDIRADGGLVFNSYWGDNKNISYETQNKIICSMHKKMAKLIIKHSSTFKGEKKKTKTLYNNTDKKKIKEILSHIKCYDDYTEWFTVGMALKDWNEVKGLKLWDKWSKQSEAYEEGACEDKWKTFDDKGETGLGTLYHLAEADGYVIEHEPEFSKKKSNNKPLSQMTDNELKKQSKKKRKKSSEYGDFTLNKLPHQLNDELINNRRDQISLFDGVLTQGMHTFIYGSAGSNKTTSIAWLLLEVLKKFEDKIVHFWSFDASQNHEQAIYDYAKSINIDDSRFMLSVNSTSEDFFDYYNDAIEGEIDMSNVVIVTDTFKFITKDVNNKNANKDALHFIKDIQKLGASAITLGHSNKDGVKQSGTAEIEQDTEAILRIDRVVDTFTGEVTLTISEAGRVRLTNPCSTTLKSKPVGTGYVYLKTAMETMRVNEEVVDIASGVDADAEVAKKEKELVARKAGKKMNDILLINDIRFIIQNLSDDKKSKPLHNSIKRIAKIESSIGHSVIDRIMREYNDDEWTFKTYKPKNGGRPTKLYKLIKKP